jgi:hypothetical protein
MGIFYGEIVFGYRVLQYNQDGTTHVLECSSKEEALQKHKGETTIVQELRECTSTLDGVTRTCKVWVCL